MWHLRICELATIPTAIRYIIAFVIIFGLVVFVGNHESDRQFWILANQFFAFGFLPIYCLVKGGDALRTELKEGTMEFLWTRPIRKASLFIGFYISSLVSIFAFTLVCMAAIIGAGIWHGEIATLGQAQIYCVSCLLISVSFTALSLTMSTLTSKFIVVGILYYFFIEKLLGQLPTSASKASIVANLKPHLNSISNASNEFQYIASFQSASYILAITALALIAGAAIFTWKHYNLGEDK